jgi:hypothetical protein
VEDDKEVMMEVNKKSENLELDIHFGDGTSRRVLTTSGTIDFLKRVAMDPPFLFFEPDIKPLPAGSFTTRCIANEDDDVLQMPNLYEVQRAIYRLGQMDMRQAAADLLLDLADGTQGDVCTTLIDAAQRVRDLKVCDTVKEEISETD